MQAEVLNNAVCQPDARCLTTMETGGWGQTLTHLQLETWSEDDFGFSINPLMPVVPVRTTLFSMFYNL